MPVTELSRVYDYKMKNPEFLARAREIWEADKRSGGWWRPESKPDMLEWLDEAAYRAKHLSRGRKELFSHWLMDWAEHLRWLRGEYERLKAAAPGEFYIPAHNVAEAFHRCEAFIKLFASGNRCSKTQSAYQETFWIATNQHPYVFIPVRGQSVAIIGTDYQTYSKETFGTKMIDGETGNELSPYFPENGKWLYNFDRKSYRLTIACPECAAAGKPRACTHPKGRSTIKLFSNEGGAKAIMGAQYTRIHLDEHQDFEFYREGIQRLSTVSHSSMVITGSPLYGPGVWEHRVVEARAKGPADQNQRPGYPEGTPYAAYFNISQTQAGLRTLASIEADARDMSRGEYQARVLGIPAATAENPVFDQFIVDEAEDVANQATWQKGELELDHNWLDCDDFESAIVSLQTVEPITWRADDTGRLSVMEFPVPSGQYLIGVDTASGVGKGEIHSDHDYSCANVFKMENRGGHLFLRLVAQWHGYLNPHPYADQVKLLGIYYNAAQLVVETTGGLGLWVLSRLKEHLYYPFIWQDKSDARQKAVTVATRFGVDTNVSTKPLMVAAAQQMWKAGRLEVFHTETLRELRAFSQFRPQKGKTLRYEAAEGGKDDRVMALVFACYAVAQNPTAIFDWREYSEETAPDRAPRKPVEKMLLNPLTHRKEVVRDPASEWAPWENLSPWN